MNLLDFFATVILVTASGALSPGPLFFAVVSHGSRSGARGGLAFSVGHTIVEFPLVLLLALGLLTFASKPAVKFWIGISGGMALLVFGALQVHGGLASKSGGSSLGGIPSRNPLLLGLLFTGLNPYFLVWWLTVGAKLILDSLVFGPLAGVVFMFVAHVWIDYAWLVAVAHLARIGTKVVGTRGYRALATVFGAVLIYYGITFLMSAL